MYAIRSYYDLITLSVIAASLFAGTTETSPLMQFYLSRFALPVTFLENLGMLLNSYAARFEPSYNFV